MKAIRIGFNIEVDVREMTADEIDTSDGKWFCDDETCIIYKKSELKFI